MSYIRFGYAMKYVKGNSKDYVFTASDLKGNESIEDYGSITDNGFIELLFQEWETKDITLKEHLLKRLAKRLKVELRDKPLTNEENLKEDLKILKEFNKKSKKIEDYIENENK